MKITAKYAGFCPRCDERFEAGTTVEWRKGSKACHVSCGQLELGAQGGEASQTPAPQAASQKRPARATIDW
jgi:hypothetical protein